MLRKKYWQLLVGVLISALFIYWALPGLHLPDVAEILLNANYWWILPGVLIYFVGLWVRTWRWHYTLRPLKVIRLYRLFPLVCIGYFGNNVYPFRAGEVIRSVLLRTTEGVAISSSLATVFIERIFDGLTMLLFVFLALPFAPMPESLRNLVIGATILFLAATLLFVWAALRPERVIWLYSLVAAYLVPRRLRPVTDDLVSRFIAGLKSLSSPYDVVMIFFTSILIWLIETVKYWFVMHAFPFQVSFLVLMLINGVVNLATTLPSAPGYVGTFDAPGIMILEAFGIDKSIAASYILTLHVALWVPVTIVGGYFFLRAHLGWSDFSRAAERAAVETGVGEQATTGRQ